MPSIFQETHLKLAGSQKDPKFPLSGGPQNRFICIQHPDSLSVLVGIYVRESNQNPCIFSHRRRATRGFSMASRKSELVHFQHPDYSYASISLRPQENFKTNKGKKKKLQQMEVWSHLANVIPSGTQGVDPAVVPLQGAQTPEVPGTSQLARLFFGGGPFPSQTKG